MMSRRPLILSLLVVLGLQDSLRASSTQGVFFEPQQVARYRELFTRDPLFADLRKQMDTVDRARERKFLRTEVRYNDHLYDIARVGNLAQQMALLYVFAGDTDAAALARECVETLMKFPKWDYFLEGGKDVIGLQRAPNSAIAVAIVVEALGDRVPLDVRERWLSIMAERGTEPCFRSIYGMRYPRRVKGWSIDTTSTYFLHRPLERTLNLSRWPIILNTINLKAIPSAALALSALVYRNYFGETADTRRWLEQASYSIGTFHDIYARDGSYKEGVSYAHYTTLHIIQAVDALRRAGVADLSDMLNWNGYQDYLLAMTLPTREDPHAIVNFSDAGTGANASPSFWIARETRDGLARWFGEHLALARDLWSVLYYDPTVPLILPQEGPQLWCSDLGWIVGRTGYAAEDFVVAMRSGGPYNHEHADRNGLIVKCYGERLVVDPMRPPYSYRDPSWKMRLTAGHSCVLIDGKGHQYVNGHEGTNASQARATIIRRGERDGFFFWSSDATAAYRLVLPDVRSITRTVVMFTEFPAVVVVDKVIKESVPSTIQARFYADNLDGGGAIAVTPKGFTVTRPYAHLLGCSSSNAGVTYAASLPDIPPEKARLYPFVDASTVQREKEICLVTVLLPRAQGGVEASASVSRDGQIYTARFSSLARTVSVVVIDSGVVPEFEVDWPQHQ
jgi:hypothetical protein